MGVSSSLFSGSTRREWGRETEETKKPIKGADYRCGQLGLRPIGEPLGNEHTSELCHQGSLKLLSLCSQWPRAVPRALTPTLPACPVGGLNTFSFCQRTPLGREVTRRLRCTWECFAGELEGWLMGYIWEINSVSYDDHVQYLGTRTKSISQDLLI